jgi:hypothetical protein
MIVLSATTLATASGVGTGVFAPEHAAAKRLASISVINNL